MGRLILIILFVSTFSFAKSNFSVGECKHYLKIERAYLDKKYNKTIKLINSINDKSNLRDFYKVILLKYNVLSIIDSIEMKDYFEGLDSVHKKMINYYLLSSNQSKIDVFVDHDSLLFYANLINETYFKDSMYVSLSLKESIRNDKRLLDSIVGLISITEEFGSNLCFLVLRKYGWLGIINVDSSIDNKFWLLIQHSDNNLELQKFALEQMWINLLWGNTKMVNYAYLYDRYNINMNNQQLFGTQLDCDFLNNSIVLKPYVSKRKMKFYRKMFDLQEVEMYLQYVRTKYLN